MNINLSIFEPKNVIPALELSSNNPDLKPETLETKPNTILRGISCASVTINKTRKRKKLTPAQKKLLVATGDLWHRIMEHICAPYVNRLPNIATGIDNLICTNSINILVKFVLKLN